MMEYTTTVSANEPIVITIGNFDGIHLGHQRLMHEVGRLARDLHSKPVLVTFTPHTLIVVRPDLYVRYLSTLEEKLSLSQQYGDIADNIVIHFTTEVASMSAEHFMDTLCNRFSIRGLVVGANFSLGHNRMGDTTFLENYGRAHDIQVRIVPLEEADHARISSTRIRSLVGEGKVSEANELLGHPVVVSGTVAHGDERGRLLGFPTANLDLDPHRLLPADGVYATRVHVHDDAHNGTDSDPFAASTVYNGVVNIGVRPTFNGKKRLVEAYLLDADLDLYGKRLTLDFIAHLRNEQRFSGIDALKAQIASDVSQARQILSAIGG